MAKVLAVYKDSIIADAAKIVTSTEKFDAVRSDALRKVRDAILDEAITFYKSQPVCDHALQAVIGELYRLRSEA